MGFLAGKNKKHTLLRGKTNTSNTIRRICKAITIAASMVIVYLLWAFSSTNTKIAQSNVAFIPPSTNRPAPYTPANVLAPTPKNDSTLLRPPSPTNFLFIGVDNNNLADAIMVGSFYRDNGEIKLMSVPRDMRTTLPKHRLEDMAQLGIKPPETLKINAVRAFGGRKHGPQFLKQQLSDTFGVHFDYYVEVELAAFQRIIDAIGGVEMDIPQRMYYECEGLIIDIPPGRQVLNGAMAENVVRFRSFPTGDLMRNNTHMDFMTQLITQVLSKDSILKDPMAFINVIISDVRTDIGPLELAKYIPYIGRISSGGVQTFTMPGSGRYQDGISWFFPNQEELPETIKKVFTSP